METVVCVVYLGSILEDAFHNLELFNEANALLNECKESIENGSSFLYFFPTGNAHITTYKDKVLLEFNVKKDDVTRQMLQLNVDICLLCWGRMCHLWLHENPNPPPPATVTSWDLAYRA